jgi:tetratricopeptide (TPR) repeat protein
MSTRSPNPRVTRGSIILALMVGAGTSIGAQQAALRPGQSPGPRFIMPTLVSDGGGRLGFQVANAVRERIAADVDIRTLWVVPESTITKYLIDAGYPADQPLSTTETRQLAASFRADELLNGIVSKTPSGTYRVQMSWSLAPREDMVQPLPAVEAAKISDVAKLVSREFLAARRQVESVQRCVTLARARNYTAALAEARKAIDAYPQSVLGRVCIANIYDQQKLGPDSMIRISEQILAIHPENARALAFAADAYQAKQMVAEQIRTLRRLVTVDATNRRAQLALATALANSGKADSAQLIVDAVVAEDPTNLDAVSLAWRVHLATRDWLRAIELGEQMIAVDPSLATRDFFVRMIAASEAAGQSKKSLDLATRGTTRFPTDDELAVLRVQFLRRDGQLREALDAVRVIVTRSPRAPNAWPLKARLELELGLGPDSVLASLQHGIDNGDRSTVASYGRSFGQTAAKDTTAPNKLDPLRAALRYLKLSDSAQPNDTTTLLIGSMSVTLAQRIALEPTKRCDTAKEMAAAIVDAQIALPKVGRVFPDPVARLMTVLAQVGPYSDQVSKAACRTKDEEGAQSTP